MATGSSIDDLGLQFLLNQSQWSCSECTFNNPIANFPICEMCENKNQSIVNPFEDASLSITKWSCPRCTFDNLMISQRCTMCGQAKSSAVNREFLTCMIENFFIFV